MPLYRNLGFKSHPFAKTNADEEPQLAYYFVPPPFFDGVLGDPDTPSASIVLAPRGGGKTALRRMLEEKALENGYLPISYDRFEFGAGQRLDDINLQYHLRNILTRLLIGYLSYLADYPDLISRLPAGERKKISVFAHTYLGDMTGDTLQEILRELKGLPERIRAFWNEKVGFLEPFIHLLLKRYGLETIDLPGARQEEKSLVETYKYQLEYLVGLARSIGFHSVYILLDKPDETELTSNDALATYTLIRPLVRDLELLGMEAIGFKFFLWDQVETKFIQDARPDRIQQFRLIWLRDQLQRVLAERLKAFSDGNISSIGMLCADKPRYDVDAAICIMARGSPRNVIRICERILSAQAEHAADADKIALASIDLGIMNYCEQSASEQYGEDTIKDLQRVGRELFTVNYLANDVFKVHANSIRNKITGWANSGLVKQVGTVAVQESKKPLNFYYVNDPVIIRLIHRSATFEGFFADRWLPCENCGFDNLMDIYLYPSGNTPSCIKCGKELL